MLRCCRRCLGVPLLVALALAASGCTEKARNDVAASAFIKAVNLKCQITKSEAKIAWDLTDELGADDQARQAAASAETSTFFSAA